MRARLQVRGRTLRWGDTRSVGGIGWVWRGCGRFCPMEERRGRRSIRLRGWDYRSTGWYFLTVGTHWRRQIFADVQHGRMVVTPIGAVVASQWHRIPARFPNARLDSFVVMPNHVHGLIEIVGDGDSAWAWALRSSTTVSNGTVRGSVAAIIQGFKSASARRIRGRFGCIGRVWHRGYYERIVRDQRGIDAVRRYIANNPARWIEGRC